MTVWLAKRTPTNIFGWLFSGQFYFFFCSRVANSKKKGSLNDKIVCYANKRQHIYITFTQWKIPFVFEHFRSLKRPSHANVYIYIIYISFPFSPFLHLLYIYEMKYTNRTIRIPNDKIVNFWHLILLLLLLFLLLSHQC